MTPGEGAQTQASTGKVVVTKVKHNKHYCAILAREVSRPAVSFSECQCCPSYLERLGSEGGTHQG